MKNIINLQIKEHLKDSINLYGLKETIKIINRVYSNMHKCKSQMLKNLKEMYDNGEINGKY